MGEVRIFEENSWREGGIIVSSDRIIENSERFFKVIEIRMIMCYECN